MLNDKRSPNITEIMKLFFTPILIHNCFYMHPGLGTDIPVFVTYTALYPGGVGCSGDRHSSLFASCQAAGNQGPGLYRLG